MSNSEKGFERVMDVVEYYVRNERVTVKQLAHPIVVNERTLYNWLHGTGEPSCTQVNVWLRDKHLPEEFRFHVACAQLCGSGFPVGSEREQAALRDLMAHSLKAMREMHDVAEAVHSAGPKIDAQERVAIRAEAIQARGAIDQVIAATESPCLRIGGAA